MSDQIYVDKRHYDALLTAYGNLKIENRNLQAALDELSSRVLQFDDRVLEDIHQFDLAGVHSLDQERAYLIGSFNTLLAMKYNIEELEEKHHVQNRSQQNSL